MPFTPLKRWPGHFRRASPSNAPKTEPGFNHILATQKEILVTTIKRAAGHFEKTIPKTFRTNFGTIHKTRRFINTLYRRPAPRTHSTRLRSGGGHSTEYSMLNWSFTFLIVAIIAGVLGFGGIADSAASIAKILFVIFLALFVISALSRAIQGRKI